MKVGASGKFSDFGKFSEIDFPKDLIVKTWLKGAKLMYRDFDEQIKKKL